MEGARRNCVLIILSLVFFSVLAFISGLSVFLMINYSITGPSPVSAECKVLSSSVDLRSSKVCELGPLNYRNKNVLYPKERPRHKCHYDYYWASVFQVEYRPYQSGRTLQALAEAPKEALPLNCRPNFSSAWLTKNQFKVNETYACKYTPGASKVDIYGDGLFNCHREDPSAFELMRRFYNLLRQFVTMAPEKMVLRLMLWEMILAIIPGMVSAVLLTGLFRFFRLLIRDAVQALEIL